MADNERPTGIELMYNDFVKRNVRNLRRGGNGCIEWLGDYNKHDRPVWRGRTVRRIVWDRYHQDMFMKPNMVVFMRCCNPLCVAPAHIDAADRAMYYYMAPQLKELWEAELSMREKSHENPARSPQ